MKLRCIAVRGDSLTNEYLDPVAGFTTDTRFELRVGKEYTVYAVTTRRGKPWYYVIDDSGVAYPVWHPAPLFELLDSRPSSYWSLGFTDGGPSKGNPVLALPNWSASPEDFYDQLTDGDEPASSIFAK